MWRGGAGGGLLFDKQSRGAVIKIRKKRLEKLKRITDELVSGRTAEARQNEPKLHPRILGVSPKAALSFRIPMQATDYKKEKQNTLHQCHHFIFQVRRLVVASP